MTKDEQRKLLLQYVIGDFAELTDVLETAEHLREENLFLLAQYLFDEVERYAKEIIKEKIPD
jgi:hypothetical protein